MKKVVLFLLISCGKVQVQTSPIPPLTIGPDFEKAINVCDSRYGINTVDSEACFLDYRTYLSPKIGINFNSLTSYCQTVYSNPIDIKGCESDLLAILKK